MPLPLPELPVDNTGICIVIPNSQEWRQIYLGALVLLSQWWYWDVQNPEDAENVVQRVMECSYLTGLNGFEDCSMDICQQIIDCIQTNIDVQNSIQQAIQGISNVNASETVYGGDAFGDLSDCDYDAVYGYCVALWGYINQQNIDFLEKLSESSNVGESIGTLVNFIPGAKLLPIEEALGFVTNLADYNLEAYNASITTGTEQQIICDLFCIAKNNDCHISFGQVYDYMVERLGGLNAPTLGATFAELFGFMLTGVYPNDRIVFLWSVIQLGIVFLGQRFFEINQVSQYALQARTGDPDNDWELLCTDCVDTWEHTFDFTVDNGGFSALNYGFGNIATYVAGVGWSQTSIQWNTGDYRRAVGIHRAFADTTVTHVEFTFNLTKGSSNNGSLTAVNLQLYLNSASVSDNPTTYTDSTTGNGQVKSVDIDNLIDDIACFVSSSRQSSASYSGACLITSCTVHGEGVNPFV